MAYYIEDQIDGLVFGERRPTINEYFLSSYSMAVYDGCEFGCAYCDGWAYRTRPFNETIRIATDLPTYAAEEIVSIDRGDLIGITALTDPATWTALRVRRDQRWREHQGPIGDALRALADEGIIRVGVDGVLRDPLTGEPLAKLPDVGPVEGEDL